MSDKIIRELLEARVDSLLPSLPTAWENVGFKPVKGVAHQRVFLLLAEAANPTLGDDFYRQPGILQVSLYYPESTGTAAAASRAQLLKDLFKRGTTLMDGALRVLVHRSPYTSPGFNADGFFMLPVSVPFVADIVG